MANPGTLSLLTCGGTIAMDEHNGVRRPASSLGVAKFVAEKWPGPVAHIEVSELDSAEARPSDWNHLVSAVLSAPSSTILITHGTGTLAWTAAALAVAGVGRTRTVVLTGANTPLGSPVSDAPTNLTAALAGLKSLGPGVWVVFSGVPGAPALVTEGGFARKMYASGLCFVDVAGLPFATIDCDTITTHRPQRTVDVATRPGSFTSPVELIRVWPGGDYSADPARDKIVVELYACGTAPRVVVDSINRWHHAGKRVVVVALTPSSEQALYESTNALRSSPAEVRFDLTAELAVCALMYQTIPIHA